MDHVHRKRCPDCLDVWFRCKCGGAVEVVERCPRCAPAALTTSHHWDHTRTVVLGADGVRLAGETPWGWAPVPTSSREAPDPMDLGRIHYMEGRWS